MNQKIRYLIVGAFNTGVGYLLGVFFYHILKRYLHIVEIGLLTNFICISISFVAYKLWVFKTVGNWTVEYFRCFLVYGFSGVISIIFLYLLVDVLAVNIWFAQALAISITIVISYIQHNKYTFKQKV